MDNVYIDSLQFGFDNIEKGISYLDLKEHLHNKGYRIKGHFENQFRVWFFLNFLHASGTKRAFRMNRGELYHSPDRGPGWLDYVVRFATL